jgi:hypothetical protein
MITKNSNTNDRSVQIKYSEKPVCAVTARIIGFIG